MHLCVSDCSQHASNALNGVLSHRETIHSSTLELIYSHYRPNSWSHSGFNPISALFFWWLFWYSNVVYVYSHVQTFPLNWQAGKTKVINKKQLISEVSSPERESLKVIVLFWYMSYNKYNQISIDFLCGTPLSQRPLKECKILCESFFLRSFQRNAIFPAGTGIVWLHLRVAGAPSAQMWKLLRCFL